jgi:hypothetical protein
MIDDAFVCRNKNKTKNEERTREHICNSLDPFDLI